MAELPRSIVCPVDGNVNPFDAPECMKCGLPLGPVRAAIAGTVVAGGVPPAAVERDVERSSPTEPAPLLPELPQRADEEPTATFVDSSRFLIRGMGNRSEEIAARLFKQLADRGIDGLRLSLGKLIIKLDGERTDQRDYYFGERVFTDQALATMAVRIAPVGSDLFVEWRHYTTPGLRPMTAEEQWESRPGYRAVSVFQIILCLTLVGIPIAFIIDMIAQAMQPPESERDKVRKAGLEGFQTQDSTAFQLTVRAALEEAIDLAGISKALIQELPKDENRDGRVI